jgi:hypothetical protein
MYNSTESFYVNVILTFFISQILTVSTLAKLVPTRNLADMLGGNDALSSIPLITRRHLTVASTINSVLNCNRLSIPSSISLKYNQTNNLNSKPVSYLSNLITQALRKDQLIGFPGSMFIVIYELLHQCMLCMQIAVYMLASFYFFNFFC